MTSREPLQQYLLGRSNAWLLPYISSTGTTFTATTQEKGLGPWADQEERLNNIAGTLKCHWCILRQSRLLERVVGAVKNVRMTTYLVTDNPLGERQHPKFATRIPLPSSPWTSSSHSRPNKHRIPVRKLRIARPHSSTQKMSQQSEVSSWARTANRMSLPKHQHYNHKSDKTLAAAHAPPPPTGSR